MIYAINGNFISFEFFQTGRAEKEGRWSFPPTKRSLVRLGSLRKNAAPVAVTRSHFFNLGLDPKSTASQRNRALPNDVRPTFRKPHVSPVDPEKPHCRGRGDCDTRRDRPLVQGVFCMCFPVLAHLFLNIYPP